MTCESFGRHDCNPGTILMYPLNKPELASWANRDIVAEETFSWRRPPSMLLTRRGERHNVSLTRKWFGFVTHQTQICHHMLGFVRQQTQICHRIQHLLVTGYRLCASLPLQFISSKHVFVFKRM